MAAVATMPGLRPLGFGEILDVGIKLYLRNWRPLILCVVGLVLPVQIVSVLLLLSVSPDLLDPTATSPDLESEDASALLAAQGVSALLQGIVYVIATAACFKAVSDAYLGSTPSAGRSLRFAVRALPRLLLLGLVYVLFVGVVVGVFVLLALISPIVLAIAIVAAIVPVIYLSVALTLTVPALLFERVSPVKALGRSYRLVKGRWWSICGIIIVGVMLVSFIAGILQAVIQIVPALLADGNEAVLAFSTVVAGTVSQRADDALHGGRDRADLLRPARAQGGLRPRDPRAGAGGELRPRAGSRRPSYIEPEVTPEQRAAAPFWPPPPGWKPPEEAPASTGGWAHPAPAEPPAPTESPPDAEAPPEGEEPPRPWDPPRSPSWPPEPPERGAGGL